MNTQDNLIHALFKGEDVRITDEVIGDGMKSVVHRDSPSKVLGCMLNSHVVAHGEYYLQVWTELVSYCKSLGLQTTVSEETILSFFEEDKRLRRCFRDSLQTSDFAVLRKVYNIMKFSTNVSVIVECCPNFSEKKASVIAEENKKLIHQNVTSILAYLFGGTGTRYTEIANNFTDKFLAISKLDAFQLENLPVHIRKLLDRKSSFEESLVR